MRLSLRALVSAGSIAAVLSLLSAVVALAGGTGVRELYGRKAGELRRLAAATGSLAARVAEVA